MAWSEPRTWVAGEKPTAAIMNTHIRDQFRELAPGIRAEVGMPGAPPFQNGWTGTVFFHRIGHIVHIEGTGVADGTTGTVIFQLPVGFRPVSGLNVAATTWNTVGDMAASVVSISTNGQVTGHRSKTNLTLTASFAVAQ